MPISNPSGSGFVTKIANGTLSGTAASIDLTSIPAGYYKLELWLYTLILDAAANVGFRFNADTGNNYNTEWVKIATATVSGQNDANADAAYNCNSTGATAAAQVIVLEVFNHNALLQKQHIITSYTDTPATDRGAGRWTGTAEISRITAVCTGGHNFDAGTRYVLVGYK